MSKLMEKRVTEPAEETYRKKMKSNFRRRYDSSILMIRFNDITLLPNPERFEQCTALKTAAKQGVPRTAGYLNEEGVCDNRVRLPLSPREGCVDKNVG